MDLQVQSIVQSKIQIKKDLANWFVSVYKHFCPKDSKLQFLLDEYTDCECNVKIINLKYDIFQIHFLFDSPTVKYTICFYFNHTCSQEAYEICVQKCEKNEAYAKYMDYPSADYIREFLTDIQLEKQDMKFLSVIGSQYYEYFFN